VPTFGSKAAAMSQVRDGGKVRLCGMADTVSQGSFDYLEDYSGSGRDGTKRYSDSPIEVGTHVAPSVPDAGSGHLESTECECCGRIGVRLFSLGVVYEDGMFVRNYLMGCAECFEDVMGYDPR